MDLFYSRMSGNSARAVFALFESGIPWQPRRVDPHAGETRAPSYLAVNPMGKIPALVDGAFILWESNAINWYVAEKHPESRLLPPSIEGRAAVQRWLFFQAGHIAPASSPILRTTNTRIRTFWNAQVEPPALEAAEKELRRFLPVLETALAGRVWLEGELSLADIAYAPHFALMAEGGFDFAPYPAVDAWLKRMWERPAWQETARLVFP